MERWGGAFIAQAHGLHLRFLHACSGAGRDADSENKAAAFLENKMTVGGEAHNCG